jgi:hypothetical protein
VEVPTECKHLIIDHVESKYTDGISSLLAPPTVVSIHHAVAHSWEYFAHRVESAVKIPNLWGQPVIVEDVNAVIVELVRKEGVSDKELADRYDDV